MRPANPDPGRPVVLRNREVKSLRGTAAMLERKKYRQAAEVIEAIVQAWDGAEDFVIVHRSALNPNPATGEVA